MSIVTCNDQDFDFETVSHSKVKDLTNAIQSTVETDREFLDTNLAAHPQSHGGRFSVRRSRSFSKIPSKSICL